MNFLFVFRLSGDGERNEPRNFISFLEPPVGYNRLKVFPSAEKFEVLGHPKDIQILVGPDFAITSGDDDFAQREEIEANDGP